MKPIEEIVCPECGEEIKVAGYSCQNCCDHEPDSSEGYTCLLCGKDCFEDFAARAFDLAKDRRKYGCDA